MEEGETTEEEDALHEAQQGEEEDNDEEAQEEEKSGGDKEQRSPKAVVRKAAALLVAGTALCALFSDPVVEAVSAFSKARNAPVISMHCSVGVLLGTCLLPAMRM